MAVLSEVVRHVQNPAFGAALQWRFVVGHTRGRSDASGCPVSLLFVVLPIVFHQETGAHLHSTRKGLRAFVSKFDAGAEKRNDVLLGLHDRAARLRTLSLESLRTGIAAQLFTVDVAAGIAFQLVRTAPQVGIPESVRVALRDAEKLGQWCGELTLLEVAAVLRVRF